MLKTPGRAVVGAGYSTLPGRRPGTAIVGEGYRTVPSHGFPCGCSGGPPDLGYHAGDRTRVARFLLRRERFEALEWTPEQIGAWDPDPASPHRTGMFLSMFYALQLNNQPHPWNEVCDEQDRGLGAHIDQVARVRRGLDFSAVVYDRVGPEMRSSDCILVPSRGESHPGALAWYRPSGRFVRQNVITIRHDMPWALGHRMDEAPWIQGTDGRWRMNMTHLIAHEAGHHFGFPHVDVRPCIMHSLSEGGADPRPVWQQPEVVMKPLFENLVDRLAGVQEAWVGRPLSSLGLL